MLCVSVCRVNSQTSCVRSVKWTVLFASDCTVLNMCHEIFLNRRLDGVNSSISYYKLKFIHVYGFYI